MEIDLKGISFAADIYDVRKEFARILHSDIFRDATKKADQENRRLNFDVELNGKTENIRHNGTGRLILPSRGPGRTLLQFARNGDDFPTVHSRRILMADSGGKPNKAAVEKLRKVPFQDPSIERERDDIIFRLETSWRIEKLQLGTWLCRPTLYPCKEQSSIFAVEWEKDYVVRGNAHLAFDYDKKLLRLDLGEPASDLEKYYIIIKFFNIQQMWVGYEFNPYICFDILTPPIFERECINRTLTGRRAEDKNKHRQRICALDEHHRLIGQYAYQIRVRLYERDGLERFVNSCAVAGLRKPIMANVISQRSDLFSQRMLSEVQKSFKLFRDRDLPWTVLFQIESFINNGLLTTKQYLNGLLPSLKELMRSSPAIIGILLRDFMQTLRTGHHRRDDPRDVAQLFENFRKNWLDMASLEFEVQTREEQRDCMACHHVTFSPTRMLLEGPYPIQSNRVLRQYDGFHDHFLRVEFRDEDRIQFRWSFEVDGTLVLQRVATILKEGFDLAGRHFEFLAYSSSALREHSTWFVSPFVHPMKGKVTAASIRKEIGDLKNYLNQPAKFAARLALAFTSTNPSVKIARNQWTVIDDEGTPPYLHTEGVGTISRELGRMIWQEECKTDSSLRHFKEPSAYQIRFLGYKGVVSIDDSLSGVQMCLRPSMEKFEARNVELADIEIAKAFYTPTSLYLNRPLVMILEDRGAPKEAFMALLDATVTATYLIRDSLEHFRAAMGSHGLGSTFGLIALFGKLSKYGLKLDPSNAATNLRSPFVDKLIDSTIASILRDIRYRCRIPVPKSYTLVGVVDEGPAWIKRGKYKEEDVFTLNEGELFACIQKDAESEPIYLERICIVFRSPLYYSGDIQRAWAVGKPPDHKICAFRNLVNVVVFPSKGPRSFASKLSGGDLDGDTFNICQHSPMFGSRHDFPAEFPQVGTWKIDLDDLSEIDPKTGVAKPDINQERVVPYVCDFITQYIENDVLGILADKFLVRADQSMDGVLDKGCIQLAELCNQAVDYPKNGKPVDISNLPPPLLKYRPDWSRTEDDDERRTDFYLSERVVGEIYRKAETIASSTNYMKDGDGSVYHPIPEHPIYITLRPIVENKINRILSVSERTGEDDVRKLFRRYSHELTFICATHTLTDHAGARLKEEEVVIGTILARCSRHRWRTERMYRMRVHAANLVRDIREQFVPRKMEEVSTRDVTKSLEFAWSAWRLITDRLSTDAARRNSFGLNSFSFLALNAVLECLDYLGKLGC